MVQSAVWPEQSVRELIELVDGHKGPESQLIKNNKVCPSLNRTVPDETHVPVLSLLKVQIADTTLL